MIQLEAMICCVCYTQEVYLIKMCLNQMRSKLRRSNYLPVRHCVYLTSEEFPVLRNKHIHEVNIYLMDFNSELRGDTCKISSDEVRLKYKEPFGLEINMGKIEVSYL